MIELFHITANVNLIYTSRPDTEMLLPTVA